ncbi:MAG: hypothetical protein QOC69_6629 [Mycobacterium sp.]|jgi:hypothetical protein|nr:hypothetical protein [Mycobacterium sp.]
MSPQEATGFKVMDTGNVPLRPTTTVEAYA